MGEALAASLVTLPVEIAERISTLAGGAENIPVEVGSVDAVTSFQAWHWFEAEVAAADCARVLRSGGWLSIGWRHRFEDLGWSRELSDIVEHQDKMDDREDPPDAPQFDPAETELFRHAMSQSVQDLVLHASTWSYAAIHPERDRILDEVRALGRRVAGSDGLVEIPLTTGRYRMRRR